MAEPETLMELSTVDSVCLAVLVDAAGRVVGGTLPGGVVHGEPLAAWLRPADGEVFEVWWRGVLARLKGAAQAQAEVVVAVPAAAARTLPVTVIDLPGRAEYLIVQRAPDVLVRAESGRRLAEVMALQALAQQITGSLDTADILLLVVDTLRSVFRSRTCVIALREAPDADTFVIRAAAGANAERLQAARFRVGEGVAGQVVATGRRLYLPDVQAADGPPLVDPEVRSVIAVPIAYQGRVLGSLNLDSQTPDAFSPEHERILTIAAAQIAAALEIARLYEEETARAARLAEANAALQHQDRVREELVQNLAHELRNPLTIIKGYASTMQDGVLGPVTPEQDSALRLVLDKAGVIQRVVLDLVTLEEISPETLSLEDLWLAQLVEEVFNAARAVHAQKDLRFELDLGAREAWVNADRIRLNQVLDNLIANAVKFTPAGGTITVTTRPGADGRTVECSIADTGIGIAPQHLPRVFDRFFQVREPGKRRPGGAGIGLAIVQRAVEAHGGRVWVESEPGQGSTFTIALPCVHGPAGG